MYPCCTTIPFCERVRFEALSSPCRVRSSKHGQKRCAPKPSLVLAIGAGALTTLLGCGDSTAAALKKLKETGNVTLAGIRVEDHRPQSMVVAEAASIAGIAFSAFLIAILVFLVAISWTEHRWGAGLALLIFGPLLYLTLAASFRGQQASFDLRNRQVNLATSGWFGKSRSTVLFGEVRGLERDRIAAEDKPESEDPSHSCVVALRLSQRTIKLAESSRWSGCSESDYQAINAVLRIVEEEMKLDVKRP